MDPDKCVVTFGAAKMVCGNWNALTLSNYLISERLLLARRDAKYVTRLCCDEYAGDALGSSTSSLVLSSHCSQIK